MNWRSYDKKGFAQYGISALCNTSIYSQKDPWYSVILQQFYNTQKRYFAERKPRQVDYEF